MTSSNIPRWNLSGDWFDVCKCKIPCPCAFAQTPTYGDCDGVLAYHIKSGQYGNISLDGLNVVVLADFQGNIWAGNTKANIAVFFDESANDEQREALNMIFSGKAGGFMAEFAKLIGEVRGIEYAPVKVEVANDLSEWSAEIPGKVIAKGEALTGPMTPPGKRVQTLNLPGSEVGPGTVATWGRAVVDEVNAPEVRYEWKRTGRSSKHIQFNWSGP
ncbi:MAG TPA: DUF1326 domain-containing protein [Nitrososphaeraceae archaeon]|nr:DUF1326 domain-containing protein [Nitrososphaeraceae archaeon]